MVQSGSVQVRWSKPPRSSVSVESICVSESDQRDNTAPSELVLRHRSPWVQRQSPNTPLVITLCFGPDWMISSAAAAWLDAPSSCRLYGKTRLFYISEYLTWVSLSWEEAETGVGPECSSAGGAAAVCVVMTGRTTGNILFWIVHHVEMEPDESQGISGWSKKSQKSLWFISFM